MIDVQDTLAALVAAHPDRALTFDAFDLDCRDGQRTLIDACRAAGIDVWDVVAVLEQSEARCEDRGAARDAAFPDHDRRRRPVPA